MEWSVRSHRIPEPPVVNPIIFIFLELSVLDSLTSVLQLRDEQALLPASFCAENEGSLRLCMHLKLTSLTLPLYVVVGYFLMTELVVCLTP